MMSQEWSRVLEQSRHTSDTAGRGALRAKESRRHRVGAG